MREGSLEAPTRHPIPWQEEGYYDEAALDAELRRVFDICHGCRRCFNLCDSFPRLFDLIDESPTGELDSVESKDFKPVVDACTLCDMCFMTKCPYVPPHEFDLDFPHLMLRARAIEFAKGETSFPDRELAKTDRNGQLASLVAGPANWATKRGNMLTRPILQAVADIDVRADLPAFADATFEEQAAASGAAINAQAPAYGRKALLYATCYVNFNTPGVGLATQKVLAHNGVDMAVAHPGCCGMPKLENGDLAGVAAQARLVAAALEPAIDAGRDIIALTPSCALMLKFEWPLILPEDPQVRKLAAATFDIAEYVVDIAKKEGLAPGLGDLAGPVAMHFACHSRAQNQGPKAAEMLRMIPGSQVSVVERCSGHGGKWGMFTKNFDVGIKIGKPAGRALAKDTPAHVVSECPLAGVHLRQVIETIPAAPVPDRVGHPIELFARAYGF
ncbi:heterodisulfide reductase-related iron-sulfur binding cluster [Rhizorhabdus dicambivorans]|uniref:Glycerol-3-phosphate dehydrogenase n=1 Tax=Rhizorhabdus dicambivorans TaxID=1850238 RepID=A0A2A4G198_9SPHN|nr:heterodisulfide reductase-related iron-sulfur binding cluster [Rhizorhabdus dicambivorans]ATE63343.1 glycerol-3-phosphate dehydrogenase [Rhizorhabdus dicambivorans]PCE43557.1 glycerol-3-phosphate dehydrogenase [Rhizorhabdus dicambivorans]